MKVSYTVEVSRVDHGSMTAIYNRREDAISAALIAAFALGGNEAYNDMYLSLKSFRRTVANRPVRKTVQPSLREWAISVTMVERL